MVEETPSLDIEIGYCSLIIRTLVGKSEKYMSKEKLFSVSIKDCEVQAYRGSGAGGQKRNKTSSAIRVVHRASGASGSCENYREQSINKQEAFRRMTNTDKFKQWVRIEAFRVTGELAEIDQKVDKAMEHVKIEGKTDGKWVELDE